MLSGDGRHSARAEMGSRNGNADAPSGVLIGVSELAGSAGAAAKRESAQTGVPALHVLVVDDDHAVRKACVTIAEGMGCAVEGAESVARAKAILKHRKIDVLLLDLKLPDGGGLELLEKVKALYPE